GSSIRMTSRIGASSSTNKTRNLFRADWFNHDLLVGRRGRHIPGRVSTYPPHSLRPKSQMGGHVSRRVKFGEQRIWRENRRLATNDMSIPMAVEEQGMETRVSSEP